MTMQYQEFIEHVDGALREFLAERISGNECVRRIDDLVADEWPDDFPEALLDDFNAFHIELALYVENEFNRSEDPVYFGDQELVKKAQSFRKRIERER